MAYEIAAHAGFCMGVRRAVEAALRVAEEGKPSCTLGELIHNPEVVDVYKRQRQRSHQGRNANAQDFRCLAGAGVDPRGAADLADLIAHEHHGGGLAAIQVKGRCV